MRNLSKTFLLLLGLSLPLYARAPVVSNVTTTVLPNKKVQINYDVSDPENNLVSIFVRVSADGGTTFDVPVKTFDPGSDVSDGPRNEYGNLIDLPQPSIVPGSNKQIVWDAPADWPAQASGNTVVEVIARDGDPRLLTVVLPTNIQTTVGTPTMNFVWIRPGTFMMGTPSFESIDGAGISESPVHQVTLTKGFYMAETELTELQYAAMIPGGDTSNKPQTNITWDHMQAYIAALHEASGTADLYALPTEAQWEYACRAGTSTPWSMEVELGFDFNEAVPFPVAVFNEHVWYIENSNDVQPVRTRLPNPWGLFDMHGNVEEWVQDWESASYYAVSPALDPQGPSTGSSRIIRGGSATAFAKNTRSASRSAGQPAGAHALLGARLVRKGP